MKFAIVIPARKGSKSIKNKNLIKIKKKPLIQYTFDQIKKINILKFILTDSKQIKSVAKKNNIIIIMSVPNQHLCQSHLWMKPFIILQNGV